MTTAIDTNVIAALWNPAEALNNAALEALDIVRQEGRLVVSGPVYAELIASPGRTEAFVDEFLRSTAIETDWMLHESTWRAAGVAFQRYAARRKQHKVSGPRHILADFLIGAHAVESGYRLLTLHNGLYRVAFPQLEVVSF